MQLIKRHSRYQPQPALCVFCTVASLSPSAGLLKGDEIVIVPDGPLHLTPFAAFLDEASRYLSESFRIRIIPSLTSLKLFEDCAESYTVRLECCLLAIHIWRRLQTSLVNLFYHSCHMP